MDLNKMGAGLSYVVEIQVQPGPENETQPQTNSWAKWRTPLIPALWIQMHFGYRYFGCRGISMSLRSSLYRTARATY